MSHVTPPTCARSSDARSFLRAEWERFHVAVPLVGSLLQSSPFAYESRAPCLNKLLKLLALTPLLATTFWAAMVWWLLRDYYAVARLPNAVALALACFCLIACLGSYGFLHWQASRFRMTQTTATCFGLCVALILTLQMCFTVLVLESEKSAFVVFMGFNMAPVMLMAYLPHVRAPPLNFQQMLRLSARDPKFEAVRVELQRNLQWGIRLLFLLSLGALVAYAFLMLYEYDSWFGTKVGLAVLFCDFACYMHTRAGLNSDPLLLHGLSLLSRAILFVGWEKYWFVAVSVNFVLFAATFIHSVVDARHPVFTRDEALDAVVEVIEGALEERRAKETAERVQALEEAEAARRDHEEKHNDVFTVRDVTMAVEDALESVVVNVRNFIPGARLISSGVTQAMAELKAQQAALLGSAEFGLALLCLIYMAYTLVALFADVLSPSWAEEWFPALSTTDAPDASLHPQYQIGLITALLVVAATLFFVAYRCYELNTFHWNLKVAVAGAAFLVVSIGSSIGVSLVAESDYLYVIGIYAPLIAVVSTLTYCNWRRQDYRWNGWINFQQEDRRKKIRERKERAMRSEEELREAEEAQTAEAREKAAAVVRQRIEEEKEDEEEGGHGLASAFGNPTAAVASWARAIRPSSLFRQEYVSEHEWMESVDSVELDPRFLARLVTDFLRLRHTSADYIIFISLGVSTMLVVAFGLHLGLYVEPETAYFVASVVGVTIFTVFLLLKWFNTFEVGKVQALVNAALIIYMAWALYDAEDGLLITSIGLALVYPAVMCLIMAMYSWKMNNWKLSRTIIIVLGVGCFLSLAFITCFLILSSRTVVGVIGLISFLVGVFFLGLVMQWSSNDFHLPPRSFRAAVIVCALLVLLALVVILVLEKTWFQMVTVLWVMCLLALAAYAIQETRENDTRRLLPSLFIFPVYEYSPSLREVSIRVRNEGLIAMVLIASLCMVWGFIAALLLEPTWIGWFFFCGGGLGFLLIALEALFKPLISFWRHFDIVGDSTAIVDQARETALASQLGSDSTAAEEDQAMMMEDEDEADEEEGAGGEDGGADEEDSFKTLRRLQLYWNFEEASEVEHLQEERARFLAHPLIPDDLNVSERAQFVAGELANFDARIAQVFEEQTRILVMFQLLIAMGAQVLQKTNRAKVKDFLRKYIARRQEIEQARWEGKEVPLRKRASTAMATRGSMAGSTPRGPSGAFFSDPSGLGLGPSALQVADDDDEIHDTFPLVDLARANAVTIRNWARENKELSKRAAVYLAEQAAEAQAARWKQAEQRRAAAERKRATAHANAQIMPMQVEEIKQALDGDQQQHQQQQQHSNLPNTPTSFPGGPSQQSSRPSTPKFGDSGKSGGTGAGAGKGGVKEDSFKYRQRDVSIALNDLDIRGEDREDVIRRARAAVAEILAKRTQLPRSSSADELDHATLFSDPLFPPVEDLDRLIEEGADPADQPLLMSSQLSNRKAPKAVWKRPREICPNPKVFASESIDPSLIIQGNLEDCYLLSALSVLAKESSGTRLRDLFIVDDINDYGLYGVVFFKDGLWRTVFVDDQFPFLDNKLAFARSKRSNEFWLPIVEKCYAKLHEGYPRIIGGLVHESFQDFTGGITEELALDSPGSGAFDGRLWARLMAYCKERYLMGCGNPKAGSGQFTKVSGIVQGHAYAILDLKDVGGVKLIQLRNPWGSDEWEGDWGPGSDKWSQKMRQLCDYPATEERNGSFYMSFEDFVTNFQRVYVCRVLDQIVELEPSGQPKEPAQLSASAVASGASWCKISVSSGWFGASAAGYVSWLKKFPHHKPENNPQYRLKLTGSRPSIAFLTLTQEAQSDPANYMPLALLVLSNGGMRAHDIKKSELVSGNTRLQPRREIFTEVSLEAGKEYTVFASTYEAGREGKFRLAVYCRYPVAMELLGPAVAGQQTA